MTVATLEERQRAARSGQMMTIIRKSLDVIYLGSVYVAAACMVGILLLTLAQMVTRYAGINVRGLSDYAGYLMAASAFLAFPHAFNRGAHVRIELLLGVLGRFRYIVEIASFGLSALIAGWFAYYACRMVYWSYKFGDISTGLDATPLWIPQSAMAFGAVVFAVAIADQFIQLLFRGAHSIPSKERGD